MYIEEYVNRGLTVLIILSHLLILTISSQQYNQVCLFDPYLVQQLSKARRKIRGHYPASHAMPIIT
jgi:hypothetical protein